MIIKDKFPSNVRPFVIYITDKQEDNLLTVNHYSEMETLINKVNSFSTNNGNTVISDFCLKANGACLFDSSNPLFYY